MATNPPAPRQIRLAKDRSALSLVFPDGAAFDLSAEYLRVFSPSAEVRGHGGGEMMLVLGKERVKILDVQPVGRYAVKLVFDDGHDSGLYDWGLLRELGDRRDEHWNYYLERLTAAGIERDPERAEPAAPYDVLSPSSPATSTATQANDSSGSSTRD
ncbi:gamma-butyrobetaine hydroxylase-like domain-containing protein [Guyparkeria sp. TX1]|uniref:gamma-butyrobetaine hydroxylase-like domain-containing protein n=1 Tax=Guyparkeria sp. TX1 TaxID=3115001 RepID=UPI0039772DD8